MFTKIEAANISGVPAPTIQSWVDLGILTPAVWGDRAPGQSHRFGLLQVVALSVAAKLRATEFGPTPAGVRLVVRAFEEAGEDWLRAQFRKGRTHFVTVHAGRPLLRGSEPFWIDVQQVLAEVSKLNQ